MTNGRKLDSRHPVVLVHRVGSIVIGTGLCVFGILEFFNKVAFFDTHAHGAIGLSGNGLLAVISIVVGLILIAAGVIGGRTASTATAVVGGLFVLSGLVNMWFVGTAFDVLAFGLNNVIFSLVVGAVLLFIGLYGRASGGLPADNPYRQGRPGVSRVARAWHGEEMVRQVQPGPEDEDAVQERLAEIDELARAEHAVAEGDATPEQARAVEQDAMERSRERHRVAWQRHQQRG